MGVPWLNTVKKAFTFACKSCGSLENSRSGEAFWGVAGVVRPSREIHLSVLNRSSI